MKYRQLGRTGLRVSEIGLGCASYWGKAVFPEAEAIKLVHAAVDQGVTLFDTASSYSGGNAEPRLGKALSQLANRHDLIVATKAGSRNGRAGVYYDHSPAWIRESVENSLTRLKLDSIPLLNLHGPQPVNLTEELLNVLVRLKDEGKVRHFGTNNGNTDTIEYVTTLPIFESVMTNYSMLQPERGATIEKVASKGSGLLAGMAAAGGLLGQSAFRYRTVQDLWYTMRAWKNHRAEMRRAKQLAFLGQQTGYPVGELAIAWVLQNPNVDSALFSTTRMAHLLENLRASDRTLTAELARDIAQAQANFQ